MPVLEPCRHGRLLCAPLVAAQCSYTNFCLKAVAWLIDELKAQVPIWKKEQFEGGEVWKENAESRRLLQHKGASAATEQAA